jgi:hypothetical protein
MFTCHTKKYQALCSSGVVGSGEIHARAAMPGNHLPECSLNAFSFTCYTFVNQAFFVVGQFPDQGFLLGYGRVDFGAFVIEVIGYFGLLFL